ncbi:hypothetical protein KR074_002087, partial [Drosophila pseudoananassae]
VSVLTDQLEQPWSTAKLVRVLKNNLRPEIRHEILNVEVNTVPELREICRRRESFLEDVKRTHEYGKISPFRREVSELVPNDEGEPNESDGEKLVEAFRLVCWNSQEEGHRYQECVSERRVFCYGCGAADTYKPSCLKCSKNFKGSTAKSKYKPKTSSTLSNQSTMTE